jgi:asparagine synthase (glutamine-hydrolysing)
MCGLAAAILKKPISREIIEETMASLQNRGPNNQEYREYKIGDHFVYLIHSRLNIIDLSNKANQPYKFNNYNIIFNGEIYNYLEIKNELESAGYNFETTSDTEVLIKCIDCYGIRGTLDKLDGMFVFVCFNTETKQFNIARDRFGEKPLFYYSNNDEIYFASETKVLKKISNKNFEVNYDKLFNFIKYGYRAVQLDSTNEKITTFFKNIYEFKKSHYSQFYINDKNFEQKKYWKLKANKYFEKFNYHESKKYLKNLIINTIETRFFADVPVAYFQSGGVDSNIIATIAKHELNYDLTGFYMSNSDSRYSEDRVVDESSIANGNKIIKLNIDNNPNFIEDITKQIEYQHSPVFTTVDHCMFKLANEIKKNDFKVVLSGSGADELFTGYYDHYMLNFNDLHSNGQKIKYEQELKHWKNEILPHINNPSFQSQKNFTESKASYLFQNHGTDHIFNKDHSLNFIEKEYGFSYLRNRMCNELFNETIPQVLFQDDLNCMYHSIENRSPFLSHKLAEFCFSINQNFHIRDGSLKYLLRDIGSDYLDIVAFKNKRKVGFNYPTEKMIDFKSSDFREFVTQDSTLFDFINKKELLNMITSEKKLTNNESKTLFSIISSKIFLNNLE